ncbi:MAG: hypothetical protein JXR88_05025 [Clostridia bacterium]|nr:hypothetical protein [Clostridia bacterium]
MNLLKRRILRSVIIFVVALLAVLYYQSEYPVTLDHLEEATASFLEIDAVQLIHIYEVPGQKAYKVALLASDQETYIVLLNQGLTGLYRISEALSIENPMSRFSYRVNGMDFTAYLGKFQEAVNEVQLENAYGIYENIELHHDYVFTLTNPSEKDPPIKDPFDFVIYTNKERGLEHVDNKALFTGSKSAPPKLLIDIITLGIILFGIILTIPIYYHYKPNANAPGVEDGSYNQVHILK